MGKRKDPYSVLVGKPEGKSLERLRCRWEDNCELDVQEVGLGIGD
jgi:hypothetical protein